MLKTIHKNIKSRRKELKMTQSDLAEKLGYADKSMIAKIEAGLVDLPQSRIEAFAAALGTTKEALTGWTEERARNSFSYCVEQQMAVIGYSLTYTTEGDVILSYEGADYEITENDIKELESQLAVYLDLLLGGIMRKSRKIGG